MTTFEESHSFKDKNNGLFTCLRNKDVSGITRWLDEGADVNARDDKRNTPLHIAVLTLEKDIVKLFIDGGAMIDLKNSEGYTPKDLAEDLIESSSRSEILELLDNVYKKANEVKKQIVTEKNTKTKSASSAKQDEFLYSKRDGTSGIAGHLYETKILSLVLIRALSDKKIEQFYLGTNLNGIEALDDICIRCEVKGEVKPITVFVQVKHRENREKNKLSIDELKKETGDFSLLKYFESYLRIKEKFKPKNKDIMFKGNFYNTDCVFVIYTSVKDNLKRSYVKDNNRDQNNRVKELNKNVRDIILTGNTEDCFQLVQPDDIDEIVSNIAEFHNKKQIKELGSQFLKYIMTDPLIMLQNELIAKYHVALRREIIQVIDTEPQSDKQSEKYTFNTARFNADFFSSNSEPHIILRNTFYKDISSLCYDKAVFTMLEKQDCQNTTHFDKVKKYILSSINKALTNPCAETISQIISKIVTYKSDTSKLVAINFIENKLKDDADISLSLKNLSEIMVPYNIIEDAVRIKLESIKFKLPILFGNSDMHLREGKDISMRLALISDNLINKILKTGTVSMSDEKISSNKTIIKVKINSNSNSNIIGGLGGAVGNILILDEESKMMRFDIRNNMPPIAKGLMEKLSEQIDKHELVKYRFRINVNKFPKYSFVVDENDKIQVNEFLGKLYFFTNQLKQNEVENILKKKIHEDYVRDMTCQSQLMLKLNSDAIYLKSHDEIQKLWMNPGHVPYFTKDSDIFREAKIDVTGNPLLTIIHFTYINRVNKQNIVFTDAAIDALSLNKPDSQLFHIITDAPDICSIKIKQYFRENCIFLDFNYVLSLPVSNHNILVNELEHTNEENLVILFNGKKTSKRKTMEKLKETINKFKGTIVIVTDRNHKNYNFTHLIFKSVRLDSSFTTQPQTQRVCVVEDKSSLTDLKIDSINKMLSTTKVNFQGSKIALSAMIDDHIKDLLDGDLFTKIFREDKICIGKGFVDEEYKMIRCCFVDRSMTRENKTYQVNSIDDIEEQIVVFSAASKLGKSCLLSHLSFITKQNNHTHWIVRLNLPEHEKVFKIWRLLAGHGFNNIDIMLFLFNVVLSNNTTSDFDDNNMCEIIKDIRKDIIIFKNIINDLDSVTRFEFELFKKCYHNEKVIFFIDDFSAICPHYELEVMELLKELRWSGNRVWIATCSNEYPVIALRNNLMVEEYVLDPLNQEHRESVTSPKSGVDFHNQLDVILHYILISALKYVHCLDSVGSGHHHKRLTTSLRSSKYEDLKLEIADILHKRKLTDKDVLPIGTMIYSNFKSKHENFFFNFNATDKTLMQKCKELIINEMTIILEHVEFTDNFVTKFSDVVIDQLQRRFEELRSVINTSALSEVSLRFPSEYCSKKWSTNAVPELIQTVYTKDVDPYNCFVNTLSHAIMTGSGIAIQLHFQSESIYIRSMMGHSICIGLDRH